MIKLLVMAVVIIAIGIKPLLSESTVFMIIGVLCLIIGFGCAVTALITLLSRKPVIVFSSVSVFDRRILNRPIEWNEISKAEFVRIRNQLYLKLTAESTFDSSDFRTVYRSTAVKTAGKLSTFDINLSQIKFNRKQIEALLRQKNKFRA